jgi:hypothetical protein
MFHVMSDRFDLVPAPTIDATRSTTDVWRRAATALRLAAGEIELLPHDLTAYHRTDVWRGAVASAFGDELAHWRSRLSSGQELGLGTELRALTDRLDARALATELSAEGPLGGLWARQR